MKLLMKIRESLSAVISAFLTLLFFLFIIILNAAELSSCFYKPKNKQREVIKEMIVSSDSNNIRHRKILDRFYQMTKGDNLDKRHVEVHFTKSEGLIAASLGNGNFLFSESLFDLPSWTIDCILAHELAHDYLMHVRKATDLVDLKSFIVETLSFYSEKKTTDTLQIWSNNIVLPKYSKNQELKADEAAISVLSDHGYDNAAPTYMQMLEYIRTRHGESGGGFFDLHPSLSERIKNIGQFMENMPSIELWECRDGNCIMQISPEKALKEVWLDSSFSDKSKDHVLKRYLFVPKDWEGDKYKKVIETYNKIAAADLISLGQLQPFQQAKNYKVFEILDH